MFVEFYACRNACAFYQHESERRMTAAARVLASETQRSESRRMKRLPRERLIPEHCYVRQPIKVRTMKLFMRECHALDNRATRNRIGQFIKSICYVLTDALVLFARFDQSITVAPLDAQTNRADRIIVRDRERAAAAPRAPARVPAKEKTMLQTLRQRFFDEVLKASRQH